jgi:hypothetical protein
LCLSLNEHGSLFNIVMTNLKKYVASLFVTI